MLLRDRIAVVTGGAQGIGAAIVERFLAAGAAVAVLDVRSVAVPVDGPPMLATLCDVRSERDVARAINVVIERFGAIDVLVNNAGVNAYFNAATMMEDEWNDVFAVDLKGAWLCSKHVLPEMRERGTGSIVNIASIHAEMTAAGMFPYAAAKAGLAGLTRSLALDEAPHGIRVNAVCPGFVRTALVQEWLDRAEDPVATERQLLDTHPLGRIGTPVEVANVVVFLASDEASFITGASIMVDGGLSVRFAS